MDLNRLIHNIRRTLPEAQLVATPLPLCPQIRLYLIDRIICSGLSPPMKFGLFWRTRPIGRFVGPAVRRWPVTCCDTRSVFPAGASWTSVQAQAWSPSPPPWPAPPEVIACDIDPDALEAVRANAALNRVEVATCATLAQLTEPFDLIIAADVLYDRENFHYLEEFLALAPEILVADSRVKSLELPPYRRIAELTATTLPDLDEPGEFKRIGIYQAGGTNHWARSAEPTFGSAIA